MPEAETDKHEVTRRVLKDLSDEYGAKIKQYERQIDNLQNRIEQVMECRDRLEIVLCKLEKKDAWMPVKK